MTNETYSAEQKVAFIKRLYCPARAIAAETGCSWELILAQAAQETEWGQKILPAASRRPFSHANRAGDCSAPCEGDDPAYH